MPIESIPRKYLFAAAAVFLIMLIAVLAFELRPVNAGAVVTKTFAVRSGDGFAEISKNLEAQGLIRSRLAFEFLLFGDGSAGSLRPGVYALSPAMSAFAIARMLAVGSGDITVTIPEGWNVYQIDAALSGALILRPGELIQYAGAQNLEGRLFPDTYRFTSGENASSVAQTFLDNFDAKAQPMFAAGSANETSTLILASIIEKEVPGDADRRIVTGILEKRLAAKMPLDVDATVCYAKQVQNPNAIIDCAALTSADFKFDSPYNTYLYRGLPPGPIGNPGTSSIAAVLSPKSSSYWYYLSDSATGKTIYAVTLAEQEANQARYLK
jgi:UPF0755 protein